MGALIYGSPAMELSFDDRTLSHLQVVIGSKLRRGESFFFSWAEQNDRRHSGKNSVWLSPGIPLMFKYSGGRAPTMNTEWLRLLDEIANSGRGLVLLPEPAPEKNAPSADSRTR